VSTPAVAVKRPSQRIPAFDGARGVMSLLVLVWHSFLLISPAIIAWVLLHRDSLGAWLWFTADPSVFLTTAIVVFFMLSGIVLTLPAMRSGFSWTAYYSSRLLRLYLPAWAAILLATVLILTFNRRPAPRFSWLEFTNARHVGVLDVLWQSTLLTQTPTIDNPLWSISWEVLFSIFLPLFVLVAMKTTRLWIVVIALCILISAAGEQLRTPGLMYMPTFLIGAVMAANLNKLRAAAESLNRSRWHTVYWWLILVGSAAAIWGSRFTDSLDLVKPFTIINHVFAATFALGFTGVIFIVMGNHTATRFLTAKFSQWLGSLSYSMFLVHVPILATLGFALLSNQWIVPLIGIPLSFIVAMLFSRFVEIPAHRFGKMIGRRVASRSRNGAVAPLPAPSRATESVDEPTGG
jgi:peptidoglycan/LPS O-acetylase OafA/YrhL